MFKVPKTKIRLGCLLAVALALLSGRVRMLFEVKETNGLI